VLYMISALVWDLWNCPKSLANLLPSNELLFQAGKMKILWTIRTEITVDQAILGAPGVLGGEGEMKSEGIYLRIVKVWTL